MPGLIWQIFFLAVLYSSLSYAVDPKPLETFNPLCIQLMAKTPFEETEAFRKAYDAKLKERYETASGLVDAMTAQFFTEIRNRATQGGQTRLSKNEKLNGILGGHPEAFERPPLMAEETWKAIENMSAPVKEGFAYIGDRWAALFSAFEKDPYFKWLKHHSEEKGKVLVQTKSLSAFQDENGRTYFKPSQVKTDPIELFQNNAYVSGPTTLPIRQALIRVYRDLDPSLSPELWKLADDILTFCKAKSVMNWRFSYYLNSWREESAQDALRLAPTLEAAKDHLKQLQDGEITEYGKYFPESSYEKAISLIEKEDPSIQVMHDIQKAKGTLGSQRPSAEILARFSDQMRVLQDKIGLEGGDRFDIVWESMYRLGRSPAPTYVNLLAELYDPKTGPIITSLAQIIEIADALHSDTRFALLLVEGMKKSHFDY